MKLLVKIEALRAANKIIIYEHGSPRKLKRVGKALLLLLADQLKIEMIEDGCDGEELAAFIGDCFEILESWERPLS